MKEKLSGDNRKYNKVGMGMSYFNIFSRMFNNSCTI